MRIIVYSDTHHNPTLLRQSIAQAIQDGKIDMLIHCGDGVDDLQSIESYVLQSNPNALFYGVRGNCDIGIQHYPSTDLVPVYDQRIFITHGHLFHVKQGLSALHKSAKEAHADYVFYGHTHIQAIDAWQGITLLNPGSLPLAMAEGNAYCEIILYPDHTFRQNFIKLCAK